MHRRVQRMMENDAGRESWALLLTGALEEAGLDTIPKTFSRGKSLDVGCDTGFLTGTLRGMGVEAYGVDIDEICIQKSPYREYLIVGSMTRLPFRDGTFYTVTTCNVGDVIKGDLGASRIQFNPNDRQEVANEIYRVLRRDGLYIAYDREMPLTFPRQMPLLIEYPETLPVIRIYKKIE